MIRISVVGRGCGVEQRSRGDQPVVEQRAREPLGVDAGVDPAEQAARRGGEAAAVRLDEAHRARPRARRAARATRSAWRRSHPCSRQCASASSPLAGVVSVVEQLGVDQAVDERRRRGEEADAPVRRQDLREARDVDRPLERVERGQPRRVRRREVGVGVVLDDVQAELGGELQHAVRRLQAERRAGRVVQHRHRDVEPRPRRRPLRLDHAAHRRDVGAVGAARHRQHAHAERGQPRVLDRPAGLVDEDAVAGAQQRAGDDVERVRRADRGRDLRRRRGDAEVGELDRQRRAQARLARRIAVVQRRAARLRGARSRGASPPRASARRASRRAGCRGPASAGRRAPGTCRGSAPWRCSAAAAAARGVGGARRRRRHARSALADEEAALAARLDQALREQLVVGGDDRVRADGVAAARTRAPTAGGRPARAGAGAMRSA